MFCAKDQPFLHVNQYWNTTDPDLSPCFQKTVLLWIPCAYLILLAPFRLLYLHNSDNKHIIPWSWKSRLKLALASVITLLGALDIGKAVADHFQGLEVPVVEFLSPIVLVLTMVVYSLVVFSERCNSIRSSGFLFNFWLLLIFLSIITFRSKIRTAVQEDGIDDLFRLITFYCFFAVSLIQLVISGIVDKQPVGAVPIEDENPCPENHVSFVSQMTFWWFTTLVVKGYKKALESGDLWNLNTADKYKNVSQVFDKNWQKELMRCNRLHQPLSQHNLNDGAGAASEVEMKDLSRNKVPEVKVTTDEASCKKQPVPRLFLAMAKSFWPMCLSAAFYKFIFDVLQFASPLLLKYLIEFTKDKSMELWKGYWFACIMLLVKLFQSILLNQYFLNCNTVGMRLRTSIIAAVYQKMLKLSNKARKNSTVGEIVNLMSVDAQRFNDMMTFINMIWSGPVQITLCLYFLWHTLGPSVLAGVGVMIVMIPLNGFIANKFKSLQVKQMTLKDTRIKMMNEILNGIKVLKLYAWEGSFEQKVLEIRNKELTILRHMSYLNSVTTFTWSVAPYMVSLVTFAVYVVSDEKNILDAEKAFVSLSLFNILRFPLSMVPQVVSNLVQVNVSLTRLRNFLVSEELDPEAVTFTPNTKNACEIKDGTFTWEDEGTPTLQNIKLDVPKGTLIAVVGVVGSGKSSLLHALLGEMEKVQGEVNINGSVAYIAQQAWIQNATLQDNILFGKSADLGRYRRIIESCALQADLETMQAGDQTEIGEKGINLSGGQKQRVSLARSVYQDTDIYLMDDPLSAVDSHVGKHIFDNVIGPNGMLKNKTRILVTHGVEFLPQVDVIAVLVDGKISEMGSYKELLSYDGAFAQFLKNYLREKMENEGTEDLELDEELISKLASVVAEDKGLQGQVSVLSDCNQTQSDCVSTPPTSPELRARRSDSVVKSTSSISGSKSNLSAQKLNGINDVGNKKEEEKKLIEAEKMETDRVKLSVFATYLKSVGVVLSFLTIFFYILYNVASVYSNIWLSDWSNDALALKGTNGTEIEQQRNLRLGIYGLLGFVQGALIVGGALSLFIGNVYAGRIIHAAMIKNVLRSPMSFFDTTPTGRILNRFSKDTDTLDTVISHSFQMWISYLLRMITVPMVIGYSMPYFLLVAIPLALFYVIVQRFFVATSRQLKRLQSVSRSPIYSHFGETVVGATTVRAFRQQERFIETSEKKVDTNLMCHYPSLVSNRWLAVRLEFVGNCIVFFAALFAVIGRESLSPGIVGLSITYALSVTQTLSCMVRMTAELETNIVAVERLKEYAETPTEAAWEVEERKPSKDWPEKGLVKFDQYSTRYREGLDLVVKQIDCTIEPGEKVGIVGRTGAGKSSLTLALFRIIEGVSGHINIDGVDIGLIGLHDLRSKLTIIPQEPVLFSGTLRMNLDPFDLYSDEEIWRVLEHAHLKSFITGLPMGLMHECTEGGENLSVGQRQLVCLARALLRKTQILVLDEATAAVDLETDDLIQQTIRVEFKEATVLTIAHRLNTIMDYTRIMVLDQGHIQEFDSPQSLLQKEDSAFYGMAKDAGLV